MFSFKNIDDFIPNRFETTGMLKGKRWYTDSKKNIIGLFKPKRNEFGDKKVFCANHYGEFVGHVLASNSSVPACKVELAHLSKYYSNVHKFLNHGTPIPKDGCISYSLLEKSDELEPGRVVINSFNMNKPDEYKRLGEKDIRDIDKNDDIEIILSSIDYRTREFYKLKNTTVEEDYINEKVQKNKALAIQMMVYDCLYGNNDRHDENWSMRRNDTDIELYPLYDNERVLGLYENQNTIEKALQDRKVVEVADEILFSRMRVPGEKEKKSNYKDVLNYLIQNYEPETRKALEKMIKHNTPEFVNNLLISCEGLPECYINFANEMYKSRYEYARNIYQKKNISINNNRTYDDDDGEVRE